MRPEALRSGLFIVENESVLKVTHVWVYEDTQEVYRVTMECADGVTEMVENTCFRDNAKLAIEKWRLANAMEIDAWEISRKKYPIHWSAD